MRENLENYNEINNIKIDINTQSQLMLSICNAHHPLFENCQFTITAAPLCVVCTTDQMSFKPLHLTDI
jgi:hypothetical protein